MADDGGRREEYRMEAAIARAISRGNIGYCEYCGEITSHKGEDEVGEPCGWLCKQCRKILHPVMTINPDDCDCDRTERITCPYSDYTERGYLKLDAVRHKITGGLVCELAEDCNCADRCEWATKIKEADDDHE